MIKRGWERFAEEFFETGNQERGLTRIKDIIKLVIEGTNLPEDEIINAMREIMEGHAIKPLV